MTEFAFDPYAALAKIQNQTLTPAIVATPATEYRPPVETLATLAALAGVGAGIEKPERPSIAPSDCPITDLFERIGLMDENDGQEVYDVAARDLGYESFDAAISVIVDGWAEHLRGVDHPAIEDARTNWHWCEIAARHGWCTSSLWGQFSGLIPRLGGETIRSIYRDYAVTASGSMLMRCPRDDDPAIWEAVDPDDAGQYQQRHRKEDR